MIKDVNTKKKETMISSVHRWTMRISEPVGSWEMLVAYKLNSICFCSMGSSLNLLLFCEYFIWYLNIFKLSWWYIYLKTFSKTFGQLMHIVFETSFFGYHQCFNMHIAWSVVQTIVRLTILVWKLIFVMECVRCKRNFLYQSQCDKLPTGHRSDATKRT